MLHAGKISFCASVIQTGPDAYALCQPDLRPSPLTSKNVVAADIQNLVAASESQPTGSRMTVQSYPRYPIMTLLTE